MGHRLSKIYTRTGDQGTTGLGNGSRVSKDDTRVEAFGCCDELNSVIGMLLCHDLPPAIQEQMTETQHDLFDLGGELCIPGHKAINPEQIDSLEALLDLLNADLPALKEFILPGGGPAAAVCHLARTVCRRAERRMVSLMQIEDINPEGLKYLNRLSDLLFVMARILARKENGSEVLWKRGRMSKE